ncbi:CtrA inhibitor SciP [Oceanicella actignis]|uniref:DUF1153 domain-containing protein n=1 Tax=Oceanicella actignis TaxID=1189325 RepID=A0A1M7TBW5_9RHOB|nr:DUF1153 domain-containing protein [Oceanicella actignis]TYO89226.1 uncharacterized protein DUF1153 [Oceanicella actignis]SET54213.1 Protein of unknown function [Oceanicella actignis]SHN68176.1 Protein of unknown function [Oceanicella actignis]
MHSERNERPISVIGPDGRPLTKDDLPPPDTRRWVARRKAAVVAAVNGGLLSEEDACRMYDLSEEELDSWRTAVARHGINALRTTALQRYRSPRG